MSKFAIEGILVHLVTYINVDMPFVKVLAEMSVYSTICFSSRHLELYVFQFPKNA